jgi:hypothetical protein
MSIFDVMSDLALSICVSYVSYTSDSIARSPILTDFGCQKVGLLELYILIKKTVSLYHLKKPTNETSGLLAKMCWIVSSFLNVT